jgi:hypothetical protein
VDDPAHLLSELGVGGVKMKMDGDWSDEEPKDRPPPPDGDMILSSDLDPPEDLAKEKGMYGSPVGKAGAFSRLFSVSEL